MKNTTIEIPTVALKALQDQKSEALKTVQTIDNILKSLGAKTENAEADQKTPRRKRGSSFRLDSTLLNIKGEFTMDKAAEELVKVKLIENSEDRSELHNAMARNVKLGRVTITHEGKGRAKASYKVAKNPAASKSE